MVGRDRRSGRGRGYGLGFDRRVRRQETVFGARVEALERRSMFAADLGVRFNEDELALPGRLAPGERILAPIEVINNGPLAANGLIDIRYWLSSDTVLQPGEDRLLRRYRAEPIFLPVSTGDPNQIGTFTGDLEIPADLEPGAYHLIVRVSASNDIGDFNGSNDVGVSADSTMIVRRFGTVDGRGGVTLALLDPEGTRVEFSLIGGGTGVVTRTDAGFAVTITGSGANSAATVTASGGDGAYFLTGLTFASALGSFSAPEGTLIGPTTAGVSLGTLRLGGVIGPATITIPATSVNPAFDLGGVVDLSITSGVGIASITARRWNNTDGVADVIAAPSVGALTITNGALNATLRLSGQMETGPTLGDVNVAGGIRGGTWVVNGVGGDIGAAFTGASWSASFDRRIGAVTIPGVLRGTLAARAIDSIRVGHDIRFATINAGADYGADGVPGGSGADTDIIGAGSIREVVVGGGVYNSTIATGLAPLVGGNEQLVGGVASRIDSVVVAGPMVASRVLTNMYGVFRVGGQDVDWRTDSRARLVTLAPTYNWQDTIRGANFFTIRLMIATTNLADFASITPAAIHIVGPDGLDRMAVVTRVISVPGARRAAALADFTISTTDAAWPPADRGVYTVSVNSGELADVRGNTAPGAHLAQFTIT